MSPPDRYSEALPRPSAAAPRASIARRSASRAPNYAHPHLGSPKPQKLRRELGLFDLFAMKLCRCFVVDDMPPPNPDATVYQADKSSSSMGTGTMTTGTGSSKHTPRAPRKSVMDGIKYNKPPPEPVRKRADVRDVPREAAHPVREAFPRERVSEGITAAPFVAAPVKFGKVSSLSAMFENEDQ